MSTLPGSNQLAKPPLNWSALIQFILSGLAAFLLLGGAVIIALANSVQVLPGFGSSGSGSADPTQFFMVAASLAFAGILVLPSAWYSWRYITHPIPEPVYRPERRYFGLILTVVVLVLVVGALLLGNLVSTNTRIAWLLLPPLNILATGLPALWLVYIGTHGLLPSSPKRSWGVFASGLVLGPLIILILELLLLIVVGVFAILWVMLDPSLSSQLNGLAARLQNAAPDMNAVLNILLPFVINPGVLFLGFAFISVLVPLIEETLKPLGVWFLAGQKITSAQGFGYGVISGAGFALFENLGNTSGGGEAWALLAASRITTLLLHCLNAGLVGWALASAWSQRRFLRLGVAFTIAVLVHGLWNGMAVLSATSSLQDVGNVSIPAYLQKLGAFSDVGIIALGVLVLVFYVGFNSVLRRGLPEMRPTSSTETQIPSISQDTEMKPPPSEPSQSPSVINPSPPMPSVDNPPFTENDPHQPGAGENTSSAPESNP